MALPLSPSFTSWLKVAVPASDISRVRAVIVEPPSLPCNKISPSEILLKILRLLLFCDIFANSVPSSFNLMTPFEESKLMSAPESMVKLPLSEIVEPLIVISSTVKPSAVIVPVTSIPV